MNVDADPKHADVVADLRSLPFPDGYADRAVAVHVIEHFYRWEVVDVLREWHRVLKPGGMLALELPSMEKVFDYVKKRIERRELMSPTFSWWAFWGDPKYRDPAMCHKWGYTFPMLAEVLKEAGFASVTVKKPRYHFPQRDMRVEAMK